MKRIYSLSVALLAWASLTTGSAAQDFDLLLDGEPAIGWEFPDLDQPFEFQIAVTSPSESLMGFEAVLELIGSIEILSVAAYNEAENQGTFIPYQVAGGGKQELFYPDLGTCVQPESPLVLVTVEAQITSQTQPCSSFAMYGLGELWSIQVKLCDASTVDIHASQSSGTLWCPDPVENSSFAALKARF